MKNLIKTKVFTRLRSFLDKLSRQILANAKIKRKVPIPYQEKKEVIVQGNFIKQPEVNFTSQPEVNFINLRSEN